MGYHNQMAVGQHPRVKYGGSGRSVHLVKGHHAVSSPYLNDLARLLRASRLSIAEIERRTGLSKTTIAKIRNGEQRNSLLSTYMMLMRVLA